LNSLPILKLTGKVLSAFPRQVLNGIVSALAWSRLPTHTNYWLGKIRNKTYLLEKVSEITTRETTSFSSSATTWGTEREPEALRYFSQTTGIQLLDPIPFVFGKNNRYGMSPDSLFLDSDGTLSHVEVKCPYNPQRHVKNVFYGADKEYQLQMQFQMYVLGSSKCKFISYDPRQAVEPLFIADVEADPDIQKNISDRLTTFSVRLDSMLEKLGCNFGEQWQELF
jgi:hypothetical protein